MKKILLTALLAFAFGLGAYQLAETQTRGNYDSAKFWHVLKKLATVKGDVGYPIYPTASLPACDSDNTSAYAWDSTTGSAKQCDGSSWATVGGSSLTVGTATKIPKWNATPDDLVDSAFEDPGNDAYVNVGSGFAFRIRAVTTSRHVFSAATGTFNTVGYLNTYADQGNGIAQEIDYTVAIQDGSDTGRGLFIDVTNADHTGSSNFLYGIDIDAITGDAQATESAINIGSGWDFAMRLGTNPIFAVTTGTFGVGGATGGFEFAVTPTTNSGAEWGVRQGGDIPIVGASQTMDPGSAVVGVSAGAAADVTIITPPAAGFSELLTLICEDANLTFTDGGEGGASGTLSLAGNFTCSTDDILLLVYVATPPSGGNGRWMEVSRSVN